MSVLTRRENLLRVLRKEKPEWIPIVGHVDPYNQPKRAGMDPVLAESMGDVGWADQSTLAFSRWLDLDIMDYFKAPVRVDRPNVERVVTDAEPRTTVTLHTPVGDLTEIIQSTGGQGGSRRVQHLVRGPEDLETLAFIYEDERIDLDAGVADAAAKRRAAIGDDGVLLAFMPGTPLGMLYRQHTSVETLAYLTVDAPDALGDLVEVMGRNHVLRFKAAAGAAGVDALVGMDDTSTTVISPRMFETYCMGYTDRVAAIAHRAGKFYFHHSCGLIRDLLPLYRETDMDAVHAFTIPPIGDVSVGEGREILGDDIVIIAGLVQLFEDVSDREAVSRSVAAMFDEAGKDGFVAWLTADPQRDMADTEFVLNEARKHQKIRH